MTQISLQASAKGIVFSMNHSGSIYYILGKTKPLSLPKTVHEHQFRTFSGMKCEISLHTRTNIYIYGKVSWRTLDKDLRRL